MNLPNDLNNIELTNHNAKARRQTRSLRVTDNVLFLGCHDNRNVCQLSASMPPFTQLI